MFLHRLLSEVPADPAVIEATRRALTEAVDVPLTDPFLGRLEPEHRTILHQYRVHQTLSGGGKEATHVREVATQLSHGQLP